MESEREQAISLARNGDIHGAIAALRRLWNREPNDPLVPMDLVILLYQPGEIRAATDVFERAKPVKPSIGAGSDASSFPDRRAPQSHRSLPAQGRGA